MELKSGRLALTGQDSFLPSTVRATASSRCQILEEKWRPYLRRRPGWWRLQFPLTDPRYWSQTRLAKRHFVARCGRCRFSAVHLGGLGDAAGQVAAWSPDGQKIVFGDGHDLTMANSDGSAPTKLFSSSDQVLDVAWSPDGSLIRFTVGSRTVLAEAVVAGFGDRKRPGPVSSRLESASRRVLRPVDFRRQIFCFPGEKTISGLARKPRVGSEKPTVNLSS